MQNLSKKLAAILFGVVFALVLLEIGCQILYKVLVTPSLKAQQADQLHYYIPSDDPRLTYQMKPGYHIQLDDRRLAINQYGFRDDSDETDFPKTVALFGDSVPFGQGLDQTESAPAELQKLVGDSIKVVNFGTCGYGLEELKAYLETKYNVYKPQTIYYFLNLNDFSRRNSIYEGGDNGLYRIYKTPFFKLPFFINKAIYRYVKEGKMSSVKWYKWMFEGNKEQFLPIITEMADFAKSNGSDFRVLLSHQRSLTKMVILPCSQFLMKLADFCKKQPARPRPRRTFQPQPPRTPRQHRPLPTARRTTGWPV
ncbi:MAG: hypothetical protein R2788_17155 [Saprospiraceae bacterium]